MVNPTLDELNIDWVGVSLPPEKESLYQLLNNKKNRKNEHFIDIRDINKLSKLLRSLSPRYVIHLAAQALVLDSYKNPRNTFETNVMGTYNILELLMGQQDTETIVVATSDKVYRESKFLPKAFSESDCLGGLDPYSWSKVATESVIGAWRQISKGKTGPKIISVRSGNVIGGGDLASNRLLPDIIRGFKDNSKIIIRNEQSTRPWQHVLDPLHGYLLALTSVSSEPAFNFSPKGKSLPVKKVVEIAVNFWGQNSRIEFKRAKSERESRNLALNSKKARQELNWESKWTQEEAVVSTVRWWKNVISKSLTPREACLADVEALINEK